MGGSPHRMYSAGPRVGYNLRSFFRSQFSAPSCQARSLFVFFAKTGPVKKKKRVVTDRCSGGNDPEGEHSEESRFGSVHQQRLVLREGQDRDARQRRLGSLDLQCTTNVHLQRRHMLVSKHMHARSWFNTPAVR